ncbi:MAG: helix-turn-helix transcriptional regulator [Lachnospiraceae bacterium]|nr:helix-turn-helix transcriptional regulator [Lachnospiraceae bacterium]
MNTRIKKLRKSLDLTQQKFSERIGSTQNVVANYETGRRNPSNSVINNICKTFNVNEEWLRTGEGEMFIKVSRDKRISDFIDNALSQESSSFRHRFIAVLSALDDSDWEVLEKMALELAKNHDPEIATEGKSYQDSCNMETTSELAPSMPSVTQDVMSKLAEMERQNQEMVRQNQEVVKQNKELLARLEIWEKEEDEWEKEQMEQSISPTRPHSR